MSEDNGPHMTTIEKLGLTLLNADRVRNGWPSVDSLTHLYDGDADAYADAYRSSATAVLRAMLEPSEAMIEAGTGAALDCHGSNEDTTRAAFRAAIQAALDEVER